MTRAPRSASWRVAKGAATACSRATTVIPLNGSTVHSSCRGGGSDPAAGQHLASTLDHGPVDHLPADPSGAAVGDGAQHLLGVPDGGLAGPEAGVDGGHLPGVHAQLAAEAQAE